MSDIHCLKTWPDLFKDIVSGIKTFDIRRNDRGFKVGDVLVMQEYSPETMEYTKEMASFKVTYIIQGVWGLPEDVCVMSINPIVDTVNILSKVR